MTQSNDLMKAEEVAEKLGLAVKTVRKMTSEGRIPFVRLSGRCVRYSRHALEAWIQQRSVTPDRE